MSAELWSIAEQDGFWKELEELIDALADVERELEGLPSLKFEP